MDAREAVSARLDDELSELDAARLDAHLRDCAACRAFAAEASAFTNVVRATPLEPVSARAFVPRRRQFRGAAATAAAAAALVVAAVPSFFAGKLVAGHPESTAPTAAAAALRAKTPNAGIDPGIVAVLMGEAGASGRIFAI
ncbi:MAG TPA: zf-HC2 domain-containing protein [Gaiellaceae bacterium]|nr:zf-HC2 domain-containing protein [Gaiellaceae bacterium]